MENELRKYPIDKLSDVIDYIKQGYHSFIGCDDTCKRNQFVESLQVALDGSIQEQISCGDVLEPSEFAARIIVACRNFMAAVGVSSLQRRLSIANSLDEVMEIYGLRNRQGFLILSDVDKLVGLQRAYEIEGSLRSAMQLRDNVAVVIVASNGVIDGLVGDYDRPFYSSFRVFRL